MTTYEYIYPCERCASWYIDINSPEPYYCPSKQYHSRTIIGLFNGGCPWKKEVIVNEIK